MKLIYLYLAISNSRVNLMIFRFIDSTFYVSPGVALNLF